MFAASLLVSGLSSSTVGTMSGQVIMQGFVHWQIPIWLRRLLTMLPALIVIGIGLMGWVRLPFPNVGLGQQIPLDFIQTLEQKAPSR